MIYILGIPSARIPQLSVMTGQPQHKDLDFNINICPSAAEAK